MAARGLGAGGAVRHRKVLRDNIQGLTKPAIKRLLMRGGAERVSGLMYEEMRGVIKVRMENVVRDAVTFTEHARRKTVQVGDMQAAIEQVEDGFSAIAPQHLSKCTDRPSHKKQGSEHRFKPGTAAIKEVAYQRKNEECLSFAKTNFKRVMMEIAQDYKTDLRWQSGVAAVLQQYIESYVVGLASEAALMARREDGRTTIMPKDVQMVRRIRGERA